MNHSQSTQLIAQPARLVRALIYDYTLLFNSEDKKAAVGPFGANRGRTGSVPERFGEKRRGKVAFHERKKQKSPSSFSKYAT